MADGSYLGIQSLKGRVDAAEWQVRVELAALYRLVALFGWTDLIYTHISARVPGPEEHFLINPYGLYFDEITASSLVKVDLDGNILQAPAWGDTEYGINPAGFTIHSAIHGARPDAKFVIHLHTADGIAVSAHKEGLLPLNQHSLTVIPRLAYHDYEGIALHLDERERLVADLGDKSLMLLRNHGTLALGPTAAHAFLGIHALERSATLQVRTLSAGRDGILLAPEHAQAEVRQQVANHRPDHAQLPWAGLLRRLARESPGYDA
ncbi:class II aldolase/adducin family protein [Nitrospirillum sp. BR 11828]|uniref:class II aldolase/adducin family protein n=1 Tax=Nitrospirillum sp. BR 11828 TaxID=3104325 RepID=UPI002ACA6CE4|nr:class II aldolase/adducin family protein [Nitrospirillum sp. BR 11828]MDZ5648609.1 class II aldolase/adducin family protein [Nitrospirillum sp. BR 11828]